MSRILISHGEGQTLDGLIVLDKPLGITSARAVALVRAVTGQRKSGHAGTLDPSACGVLLICLGRATKLVEQIMDLPKVYLASARLDLTSVGYDAEKEVRPVIVPHPPCLTDVVAACRAFEGVIEQVPPRFSAVKVRGVPAYKRAAREEEMELKPKIVRVHWLALRRFDWPVLDFELCCGRGTYVRAIIRDVGARLGTGGCLISLTRTRVGPFTLEQAWTLERMRQAASVEEYLIPHERARALLQGPDFEIPDRPEDFTS